MGENKNHSRRFILIGSLLVKPAGPNCNLNCDYCFYLNKKSVYPGKTRMNSSTVKEIVSQMLALQPEVASFCWQGGEPTLMGLDFFKKIVELQKKFGTYGQRISNSLQTNGILLNGEWINLFLHYNFFVGLSLDGSQKVHDAYRKYPNGSGSWKDVVKALELLQESGVEFNILCVVTDKNVKQPQKLLDFFMARNLHYLQFIPAVETVNGKLASFSPSPLEFGEFLEAVFREWAKNFPPRFSVRYFDSLVGALLGKEPSYCKITDKCGSHLVVEHNGDVYPCDFFVEPSRKLGNIHTNPLEQIMVSSGFKSFKEVKLSISRDCWDCEFLHLCHGGCPRYRGLLEGHDKKTYFCEAYKYFLSRNVDRLKEIAKKVDKLTHPVMPYAKSIGVVSRKQ